MCLSLIVWKLVREFVFNDTIYNVNSLHPFLQASETTTTKCCKMHYVHNFQQTHSHITAGGARSSHLFLTLFVVPCK